MKKAALYLLLALVWVAGNLAPIPFVWLLWPREASFQSLPQAGAHPLLFDFVLLWIFPLQHTVWTQPRVKRAIRNLLGDHFERPAYVLASGLALLATVLFWRGSEQLILALPSFLLWPMRLVLLSCVGVQIWSASLVGAKFLTGIAHLKTYIEGRLLRPPEFTIRGPYRWIRHPIAASQIVMLWAVSSLYADRLLLAAAWTVWIVVASALEDRRLAREFGESYESYRKRAGFLWPGRGVG